MRSEGEGEDEEKDKNDSRVRNLQYDRLNIIMVFYRKATKILRKPVQKLISR